MLCNDVKDVKLRYACAPRGGSSTLQVKEKKERWKNMKDLQHPMGCGILLFRNVDKMTVYVHVCICHESLEWNVDVLSLYEFNECKCVKCDVLSAGESCLTAQYRSAILFQSLCSYFSNTGLIGLITVTYLTASPPFITHPWQNMNQTQLNKQLNPAFGYFLLSRSLSPVRSVCWLVFEEISNYTRPPRNVNICVTRDNI